MLTILVAVYGTERYLPRMLQSLCDQTRRPDRVILCDDGGGVDLEPVVEPFRDQFSCTVLRHQENEGTYAARRTLIEACQTEYAAFVDPDDQLHPQAIELWLDTALATNADLVGSALRRCQDDPLLFAAHEREDIGLHEFRRDDALWACFDLQDPFYQRLQLFSGGAKLFRSSALKQGAATAGPMGHLVFAEDSLLVLATLTTVNKIAFLDVPLYEHIERPESSSRKTGVEVTERFLQDTGRVVDRMRALLQSGAQSYPGLLAECDALKSHFGRVAMRQRMGIRGQCDARLDDLIENGSAIVSAAARKFKQSPRPAHMEAASAELPLLRLEIKDLVHPPAKVDCDPAVASLYGSARTVSSAG